MYRTHTCGELRPTHIGQRVSLAGWVDSYRDHKGVLFVDLRDRYGKTQVVFSPENGESIMAVAKMIRPEDVVAVTGLVVRRPEGTENPKLQTGDIEVRVEEVRVLNKSLTPPFHPSAKDLPGEEVRLKYRYIDLRRSEMQQTLILRHRMVKIMRDYFDELGFIEIETPILAKSTPEGARDYLVPSRIQPGSFYALPQSPQLFKQILMVAGFDRYVQIARCFRDEDLRADRQPEFTQLDLEMSFVQAEDVMQVIDGLIARLAKDLLGLELSLPLPRLTYDEAMERFGHDAPDLRFGMELVDISELASATENEVFRQTVARGGRVRGVTAPGAAAVLTRKTLEELSEYVVHDFGVKGLSWIKVESDGQLVGPVGKYFDGDFRAKLLEVMQAGAGDIMFFVADRKEAAGKALYGLRRRLGAELKLYDPSRMHFSWVVEFPMFEFDEAEGRWTAMHHPFTSPRPQDIPLLDTDPGACRAQAYDLVINGYEAGGGTIRIHDQALQQKVFQILGIDQAAARERFGFLLEALQYGAPPHGGIALGVDRLVMLFAGRDNIRDCIAFPKTQRAVDLMTGAPSPVDPKQLRELGIRLL